MGLLAWYILASYFERYRASSETRLDEDTSLIAEGKGYRELIEKIKEREGHLKAAIDEDISNGYYNKLLLYSLLRKNEAHDLVSKTLLDSRDVSDHHIFPRGLLGEKADDIGNLTLTTLGTNNHLQDKEPKEYLPNVPVKIREQHLIPENQNLWELRRYDEFLEERKELLKHAVEEFFALI